MSTDTTYVIEKIPGFPEATVVRGVGYYGYYPLPEDDDPQEGEIAENAQMNAELKAALPDGTNLLIACESFGDFSAWIPDRDIQVNLQPDTSTYESDPKWIYRTLHGIIDALEAADACGNWAELYG